MVTGVKKLLWAKIAINQEDIQVLPRHRRRFQYAPSENEDSLGSIPSKLVKLRAMASPGSPDAPTTREWMAVVDACLDCVCQGQPEALQQAYETIAASATHLGSSITRPMLSAPVFDLTLHLVRHCTEVLESRAIREKKNTSSLEEAMRCYEDALFLLPAATAIRSGAFYLLPPTTTDGQRAAFVQRKSVHFLVELGRLTAQRGGVARGRHLLEQAVQVGEGGGGLRPQHDLTAKALKALVSLTCRTSSSELLIDATKRRLLRAQRRQQQSMRGSAMFGVSAALFIFAVGGARAALAIHRNRNQ